MLHRELSFITLLVLLCQHGVKAVDLITCEGETASLTCAQGTIKVLSANFGRTNSTTCSAGKPAGQISNVQCTQSTSLSVLNTQCDGKQTCSIVARNTAFTDPCPGTYKYLNVSYQCILPPPPPSTPSTNLMTCESETARLRCAQGSIKVLSANYGRTDRATCSTGRPAGQLSNVQCTQSKTFSLLTAQCNGKQDCSILVGNTIFTDPCRGTYKYLNVTYDCSTPTPPPPPSVPSADLVSCESETASLKCAKGTIKVISANYGRTDSATCSAGRPAGQISNVQCSQNTSLSVLNTQCDGKQDCSIPVNNNIFGDPCVGTYKYLNVSYICAQKSVVICQGKSSTISCDGNRKLYIHFANYGRRDKVTCPCRDVNAMSVMCFSSQTKTLQLWCNGKKSCHLHAANTYLIDRCPRIHKYLELSYSCE